MARFRIYVLAVSNSNALGRFSCHTIDVICLELIPVIAYGYAEALYAKSLEHNGVILNSFGDLTQLRLSKSGSFDKIQASAVELTHQVLVMRKMVMKTRNSKTRQIKTIIPIYPRISLA